MVVVQGSKSIFCRAKSANLIKHFIATQKLNSVSAKIVPTVINTNGNIVPKHAYCTRSGLFDLSTAASISVKKFSMAAMKEVEESLDPVQRQSLEEECILLDENDRVVGHDTKRNCHLVRNGNILLHRAFSVFLFNSTGELLLQQRSKSKITFPLMWTNTCCSHPLNVSSELVENEALGVKAAARRRLEIELGIPSQSINLDDFQYLTRIQYKALSDSIWGEHEIDYILFLQKDVEIDPNPNEIEDVRYVSLNNVFKFTKDNDLLTPWFKLILESHLPLWWKNLDSLNQFQDHKNILRM